MNTQSWRCLSVSHRFSCALSPSWGICVKKMGREWINGTLRQKLTVCKSKYYGDYQGQSWERDCLMKSSGWKVSTISCPETLFLSHSLQYPMFTQYLKHVSGTFQPNGGHFYICMICRGTASGLVNGGGVLVSLKAKRYLVLHESPLRYQTVLQLVTFEPNL